MERKATVFNEAQLYLLRVFSRVKSEKELNELKDLISNYYANKLEKLIDKLEKEEGTIYNDDELTKLVYGKIPKSNTKKVKNKTANNLTKK